MFAPDLRFPEFSEEWKQYKVCDVLDFYSTNSLSWEQLDYGEQTLLNLHYGLIHVGLPTLVNLKKEMLPSIKEGYVPSHYELCKSGDVAFADASEDTSDVAKAIEFVDTDNKRVVCGLHTIHGRDNKGLTINGFKGYAFASPAFHHQIRRIAQGTKIFSISTKNFSECSIGIPSKAEQEKIARLLSLVDERLITQSRAIEKYESLINGLQESILWKDYKRVSFSEIFIERNERTTVANQYEVLSSTIKGIYRQSDYFDKEVASINNVGYKVLYKGDIVLSPQNLWLGNINYNDSFEIGMVSPSYKVFYINDKYNPFYISCFLKTHKALYEYACASEQGASVVRRNLDMDAFMAISIPIPSKEVQNRIANVFSLLYEKHKTETWILEKLNKQKEFLLSQMFI